MYFKRIELHGFKSFAEPTVIEFDRGITCIVGPNGSGKSNICDAVRWVLGSQSARALRGDRMEDVIFSGTASRRPRGMAEVTLVIDNSDGALDIDYNEVAVTRRMYRSGESEYLINGTICRMKDIRELIMETGIGVEGYSIIGQGRIADIISNNTESIREILEETAGIVMYRSRKAESERKLASAAGNMERVSDIIGEIEGRIDGLREESEKASRYLELRDRHKELEINITIRNIENIKEKSAEISEDAGRLAAGIQEAGEKREELASRISALTEKREKTGEDIETARERLAKVTEEISVMSGRSRLRDERLAAMERDRQRLESEISALGEKTASARKDSEELFAEKKRWDEKLETLKKELDGKIKARDEMSEKFRAESRKLNDMQNGMIDLQRQISAAGARAAGIRDLIGNLDRRRSEIEKEKDSGEDLNRDRTGRLEEAGRKKAGLIRERETLAREREKLTADRAAAAEEAGKLTAGMEEIRISIGKARERRRAFEEMENNYEGYNNAVKTVMRGGRPGILGTVAELTDAPDGFETAMETALGASMQHIICEDDEAAKSAIEMLKREKAGRSTFLPVSSVRSRGVKRDRSIESAPGFRGYGADCLEYDERFRTIVEYLVGNTVITDSMDDAIAMSKKAGGGFRFVTMEGEVITSGGSITGGRHRHGSADIFGRKAEIRKLGVRIEELGKTLEDEEKRAAELEEETRGLDEALGVNERRTAENEREYYAAEGEMALLSAAISGFESSSGRLEKEMGDIDAERLSAEKEAESIEADIREMNGRLAGLGEETERTAAGLEEARARIEKSSDGMTEARIAVSSCESEKAKADAIASRIGDQLAAYEYDKAAKEAELETLLANKRETEGEDTGNAEAIKEKTALKERLEEELRELNEERRRTAAALDDDTGEKEALDRKALSLSNQKNELDIRAARQETQLENARNRLWDEFGISYAQALDLRREDISVSQAVREDREIRNELREIGDVNTGAIAEYEQVSERYSFLCSQRDDIERSVRELNRIISDTDRMIHAKFRESFDSVVANFEEVFRELHGGGHARITLADESDPFGSEIEITAQPPGKQLKHINLLSGGEKTMTAIALMFAVLKTKPTPCCILDEVEAALDDTNLEVFGNYLRSFRGVQFTLITHQKQTMEHADVMYGITMPESGVSAVYSLRMDDETAGNV